MQLSATHVPSSARGRLFNPASLLPSRAALKAGTLLVASGLAATLLDVVDAKKGGSGGFKGGKAKTPKSSGADFSGATEESSDDPALSNEAIAAIAVGGVVVVALSIAVCASKRLRESICPCLKACAKLDIPV